MRTKPPKKAKDKNLEYVPFTPVILTVDEAVSAIPIVAAQSADPEEFLMFYEMLGLADLAKETSFDILRQAAEPVIAEMAQGNYINDRVML